jgi:transcriptional regulator with XRE-family HTH domain
MSYNELIAEYLGQLKERSGLTTQQTAEKMGLKKGNFLSMHMQPNHRHSPMSLKRARQLAMAAGLKPRQCARLILARAKFHPDSATELDKDTLEWVLKSFNAAARELAAVRKKDGE